jgi:hypothetical protein
MSTSFVRARDESESIKAQDAARDKQAQDARQELRNILQKILLESLDAQMKQAIENASGDPTALTRYRALYERRKQIGNIATQDP